MKNYHKIFITILAVILIIPQVTFAAWLNPFSWNWSGLFNGPTQTDISFMLIPMLMAF